MTVRLLTWNVEWKRPGGPKGRLVSETIRESDPHIAVLTETNGSYRDDGHTIHSEPDYGYGPKGDRRKVTLWSREPWTDIDQIGDSSFASGRFVSGRTQTPLGEILVLGVCIPWYEAGVRYGRKDRSRWEEHSLYLKGLKRLLASRPEKPFILAGDFNQRIPRTRQPTRVFLQLQDALAEAVEIVTQGEIEGLGVPVIDHVAISHDLRAKRVSGVSRIHRDGARMSDHHGIVVALEATA